MIKNIFSLNPSIYKGTGNYYVLCLYSKPLVMILHKKYEIPIGLKYLSLKVPDIVKNSNEKRMKAFLKGVFDSDGNIYNYRNKKSVQLRQKSFRFLDQLKELFRKIGIYFRDPYYDKANNSWVLWSSKTDLVDNFISIIIDPLPDVL